MYYCDRIPNNTPEILNLSIEYSISKELYDQMKIVSSGNKNTNMIIIESKSLSGLDIQEIKERVRAAFK